MRGLPILLVLLAQIPSLTAHTGVTVLDSEIYLEASVQLGGDPDNPTDLDSQTTTLNPLAASVFASEQSLGCRLEAEASASAQWHSATRGYVDVHARVLWEAISAPGTSPALVTLYESRGWRYQFQATTDDTIIVEYDISVPESYASAAAEISLRPFQRDPERFVFYGSATGSVEFDVFADGVYTLAIRSLTPSTSGTCSGTSLTDSEVTGSFIWYFASDPPPPPQGLTLTTWNPDDVFVGTDPASLSTFDASAGITGYAIESFEDRLLMPGLAIQGGEVSTTTVVDSIHLFTEHPDSLWDFATSLGLNVDNTLVPGDVVFTLPSGIRSFGVGVGDVESAVELLINGHSFGFVRNLPNFKSTGNVPNQPRQVYIRIDANEGFPDISEVRFSQSGTGSGDILFFDRLAVSPATSVPPVPGLGLWGGLGAFALLFVMSVGALRLRGSERQIVD